MLFCGASFSCWDILMINITVLDMDIHYWMCLYSIHHMSMPGLSIESVEIVLL